MLKAFACSDVRWFACVCWKCSMKSNPAHAQDIVGYLSLSIYIYRERERHIYLSISLSLYIYIYTHVVYGFLYRSATLDVVCNRGGEEYEARASSWHHATPESLIILYIYIYIHICTHTHYIYIYIYTHYNVCIHLSLTLYIYIM